jgi:H+/gluconate symporter-like permease
MNQASIAGILSQQQNSDPVAVEQTDVVVSPPTTIPTVAASVNLQNQANQRETIREIMKDIKREQDIDEAEIKNEGISITTIVLIFIFIILLGLCIYLFIKFKSMSEFTNFMAKEFDSSPNSSGGDHVNISKMKRLS